MHMNVPLCRHRRILSLLVIRRNLKHSNVEIERVQLLDRQMTEVTKHLDLWINDLITQLLFESRENRYLSLDLASDRGDDVIVVVVKHVSHGCIGG
jgi:hypothetical protein